MLSGRIKWIKSLLGKVKVIGCFVFLGEDKVELWFLKKKKFKLVNMYFYWEWRGNGLRFYCKE